jgi:type IV pilus assembly protein PilE
MIELMITVGIVAILTAIAYPAYRNYVLRGQVVNATNALSAMSANMERYFQDNRQYTTIASPPPYSPCDTAGPNNSFTTNYFTLACSNWTATTYTITATGVSPGPTAGFSYTISYTLNGALVQSSAVIAPAPSAWILSCPASWETKAGQC